MKACGPAALRVREEHVEAFKSLAHPARLEILFFLVRAGREVPVGEIQEALEIPGPTLSHHLHQLWRAAVVQRRREERFIYYAPRADRLGELVRLLTACC